MAYAAAYRAEHDTDLNQVLRVEILADGHEADVVDSALEDEGCVLSTEVPSEDRAFVMLHGTTAEATFDDPTDTLDAFLDEAAEASLRLDVYLDDELIFRGIVETSLQGPDLEEVRPSVSVKAHDGLALLKDAPLNGDAVLGTDGEPLSGRRSVLDLLLLCLRGTRTDLPVYVATTWNAAGVAGGTNPLASYHLDAGLLRTQGGYNVSLGTVLEDLCEALHLTVRQSRGAWHVVERSLLGGIYDRYGFEPDGTPLNDGEAEAYDPVVTVAEEDVREGLWRHPTGPQPRMPALAAFAATYAHGTLPALVSNGDFSLTSLNEEGAAYRDAFYDPSSGRGARYGSPASGEWDLGEALGWTQTQDGEPFPENPVYPDGDRRYVNLRQATGYLTALENDPEPTPWFIADGAARLRFSIDLRTFVKANSTVSVSVRLERPDADTKLYLEYNPETLEGEWVSASTGPLFSPLLAFSGVHDQEWSTYIIVSNPIPAGTWRVRVYVVGLDTSTIHVSNVDPRLVFAGVGVPSAEAARVRAATPVGRVVEEATLAIGSALVAGLPGTLTDADGVPLYDWKRGAYEEEEAPSGIALTWLYAAERLAEQVTRLKLYEAGHAKEFPRVWPDQALNLTSGAAQGTYEVSAVTYALVRGTQSGVYVPLARLATGVLEALTREPDRTGRTATDGAVRLLSGPRTGALSLAVLGAFAEVRSPGIDPDTDFTEVPVIPLAEDSETLPAGHQVVLSGLNGGAIQTALTQPLGPGDDTAYVQEVSSGRYGVPTGSTLHPSLREAYNIATQTAKASYSSIVEGALAHLADDYVGTPPNLPRLSIEVEPLPDLGAPGGVVIPDGTELCIRRGTTGTIAAVFKVHGDHGPGDTTLSIYSETEPEDWFGIPPGYGYPVRITAKAGDAIRKTDSQSQSEHLQTAYAIEDLVSQTADAAPATIGTLTSAVAAGMRSSLPVTFAQAQTLRIGQSFTVRDTAGDTVRFTVATEVSGLEDDEITVPVTAVTLAAGLAGDAPVLLTPVDSYALQRLESDRITNRVQKGEIFSEMTQEAEGFTYTAFYDKNDLFDGTITLVGSTASITDPGTTGFARTNNGDHATNNLFARGSLEAGNVTVSGSTVTLKGSGATIAFADATGTVDADLSWNASHVMQARAAGIDFDAYPSGFWGGIVRVPYMRVPGQIAVVVSGVDKEVYHEGNLTLPTHTSSTSDPSGTAVLGSSHRNTSAGTGWFYFASAGWTQIT